MPNEDINKVSKLLVNTYTTNKPFTQSKNECIITFETIKTCLCKPCAPNQNTKYYQTLRVG